MPTHAPFRRWRITLLAGLLLSTLPQAPALAAFTVTDSASPSVQAGQTEHMTGTVTTVYSHTGWSISGTVMFNGNQVANHTYTNVAFTGGVPVSELWAWSVPATATPGTYTFVVSAFDEYGNFLLSATTTFSVTGSTVVNGQCGSANNAVTNVMPNTNLCNAGTASAVTGTGPWSWTCAGSGGGTTASCMTAVSTGTCPQGQTYVSAGDGCVNAQASGSVQRKNFFTGFTGQSYTARPPWNVAGVDYAVGYSGTLKDPTVAGSLPACVSSKSSDMFIANGDIQPCVINNFDFSLHGGLCFMVTGSKGNTVTFTNDKFASGTNNCSLFGGFIQESSGNYTNVVIKYTEFDDNYGCNCQGLFSFPPSSPSQALTLMYNAYIGVTGRIMNGNATPYTSSYNYMEGMGNGAEHGEVVEYGTSATVSYSETWNNYYVESTNCCDTAILYIQSVPGSGVSGVTYTMSNVVASYNVLVARQGPNQYNPVAASVWVETIDNNVLKSLTITNNYLDTNGSLETTGIWEYPPDKGTGYIGTGTCSGNKYLSTGAEITGTFGSGTSTLACQ